MPTHAKTTRKVILEKTISTNGLFKFTYKWQHSKKDKDGKRRSYWLFFVNDVLILKQKVPFEAGWEHGYQNRVHIRNTYLLGSNIYQEREKEHPGAEEHEIRHVKYPVSKEKLKILNVPKDLRINLTKNS